MKHEDMSHPEWFLNAYKMYYLQETTKYGKVLEAEYQDQNLKAFLSHEFYCFLNLQGEEGLWQDRASKCLIPFLLQPILLWCMNYTLVVIFSEGWQNKQTKSIHLYFPYLKLTTAFEETSPVNDASVQENILRTLALIFAIVLLLFTCTHATCISLWFQGAVELQPAWFHKVLNKIMTPCWEAAWQESPISTATHAAETLANL